MKYFTKIAGRKRKGSSLKREVGKGFAMGAISGLAHAAVTHPIEHKLYGKTTGMGYWKHLGFRGAKAALATSATLGTFHFLNTLSKRRKARSTKVNNQIKKYKRKYK